MNCPGAENVLPVPLFEMNFIGSVNVIIWRARSTSLTVPIHQLLHEFRHLKVINQRVEETERSLAYSELPCQDFFQIILTACVYTFQSSDANLVYPSDKSAWLETGVSQLGPL